jgi:hypothetical protein
MLTWYSGAVALSLAFLIAAVFSGATLPDILLGVSTGIIATTAMIFVVQKIVDELNVAKQAPATLLALSICVKIYQTFKYTWIEMGSSRNLVNDDTDWTSREYFMALQNEINLQEEWRGSFLHDTVFLGGIGAHNMGEVSRYDTRPYQACDKRLTEKPHPLSRPRHCHNALCA